MELGTLMIALFLLSCHWIADFLCQTEYMGTMKSKSNSALLLHTFVYSSIMTFLLIFDMHLTIEDLAVFWLTTFIFHTVQDWISSKFTSEQFAKKNYNGLTGGFTIIGFDQLLHYFQLLITYYLLTK